MLYTGFVATLNDTADYIVLKCSEGGSLSHLKLQKLVYYAQAWHLALKGTPLFDGKFEAWVHGPVSRALFARFAPERNLYSSIGRNEIQHGFDPDQSLSAEERLHIDTILETYGGYSGSELEAQTHIESPWIEARQGRTAAEPCSNTINEQTMARYYRERLNS